MKKKSQKKKTEKQRTRLLEGLALEIALELLMFSIEMLLDQTLPTLEASMIKMFVRILLIVIKFWAD